MCDQLIFPLKQLNVTKTAENEEEILVPFSPKRRGNEWDVNQTRQHIELLVSISHMPTLCEPNLTSPRSAVLLKDPLAPLFSFNHASNLECDTNALLLSPFFTFVIESPPHSPLQQPFNLKDSHPQLIKMRWHEEPAAVRLRFMNLSSSIKRKRWLSPQQCGTEMNRCLSWRALKIHELILL